MPSGPPAHGCASAPRYVLSHIGDKMTEEELDKAFEGADEDGDGTISYDGEDKT